MVREPPGTCNNVPAAVAPPPVITSTHLTALRWMDSMRRRMSGSMACGSQSILTFDGSTLGGGNCMLSPRSASTIVSATTRLRYHLWLAGTICQGAHLLLHRLRASSYALR